MNGRLLLDTNVVIALFAQNATVRERLDAAEEIFIPSIGLGELYFGARKSAQVEDNLARIDEFAAMSSVLSCNAETAKHYGQIKQRLRAKGRPLPENDIWIAAVAKQYDLIVVSRDEHFNEVDGLHVEKW